MKRTTTKWLCLFLMGILMFACRPDRVGPDRSHGKEPDLAGAVGEEHPNLDTVCKLSDSIFFRSEDLSWYINICNDGDFENPQVIPCVGPQERWGSFVMYNGYLYEYDSLTSTTNAVHYLDVDFTLAAGIFCRFSDWLFTINGTTIIDQNSGFPQIGTDWSHLAPTDLRQEWKVRVPVAELPPNCFDLACRVTTVQLSLFNGEIPGTVKDIWAVNPGYSVPGPLQSNNQYVIPYCPTACLEVPQCPTPETATECEVVYKGVTCPGNTLGTTTLTPSVTGAATPTFAWSTGATTPSITVSPAATTAYTVTVSSGNCVIRTVTFNVNVIDASCVIASSGGGSNGSGPNCGPNHHSGNHSGCSHSSSHPANCGTGHNSGNHSSCTHVNGTAPNCGTNHRYGNHSGCTHNSSNPANCGNGHHNGNHTGCTHSTPAPNCGSNHRYGNHTGCTHNSSNPANCGTGHHSGNHTGCNHSSNHSGSNGSGSGGSSNGSGSGSGNGSGGGTPGVKVCHVPPGNPGGAATVCVSLANLSQHLTNVCGGGSGNGGSGSGNGGSGSGSGNGGSGSGNSGSSNSGSGNGGSGSGGHCSHNGGHSGCGSGNGSSHAGDYLGACNSNPCN